jgi:hypothetical protein
MRRKYLNELDFIDNTINRRINKCYSSRTSSNQYKKKFPISLTESPIPEKIFLNENPNSRNRFRNNFKELKKELNFLEKKTFDLNNKNRENILSNFITNKNQNNQISHFRTFSNTINLSNNKNNVINFNNKNISFNNNFNSRNNIKLNIDSLTSSFKNSPYNKIFINPPVKTNEQLRKIDMENKLNYPYPKGSLLYYIKYTSPVQNKKIRKSNNI